MDTVNNSEQKQPDRHKIRTYQWIIFGILGTLGLFISIQLILRGLENRQNAKEDARSEEIEKSNPPGPLTCNKRKGRYFDPLSKICVKATTQEQALILDRYRYVHELAAKDNSVHEYTIIFSRDLKPDELTSIMYSLEPLQITLFNMYFPEINHGSSIAYNLSSSTNLINAPKAILDEWNRRRSLRGETETETNEQYREAVENENYSVMTFNINAPSKDIATFWEQHLSDIHAIQPLINFIDKATYIPLPSLPEPEISATSTWMIGD